MPELPEVENLRRYLVREKVLGRVIEDVEAGWPGAAKASDGSGGLAGLPGRRIAGLDRVGKQMVIRLDRGVLGLHMGMTGSLSVRKPEQARLKYAHTILHLDDGRRIELDDVRKWASVVLADEARELTGSLGPDAMDPSFTADEFVKRVKPKRSAIKAVLMDQHVLAGVGNIYADEALFRAGISPLRPAWKVSEARLRELHGAVRAVLEHAMRFIEAHLLDDGRPYVVDAYDERMRLPRKAGAPCPECRTPLKTVKSGGRSAYFCPKCQR
jgi:formamidopyrimidine-DNA glycosylase